MLVAACSSIATIVPLLAKTRCRVDLVGEARLMLAVNCVRVLLGKVFDRHRFLAPQGVARDAR